jgi:hypothetical protein
VKHDYRRTPLPKSAHPPVSATMALWMGIIFSPFVAFTVNGRVDDSNWTPAIFTACCCLAGLLILHVRATRAYRRVPADIRAEYSHGRIMPPLSVEGCETSPVEYSPHRKGQPLVGLSTQGVWFAPAAISGGSWRQLREMADVNVKAHLAGGGQLPAHNINWADIAEWQVHDDSDGPDYYRVVRHDGAQIKLRRPYAPAEDGRVLDYVRTVGRRPVRLFCDIV